MLTQAMTLAELWPEGSVIVQRAADDSLDWLPQGPAWRERSSAVPLLLGGNLPIICHEAGATPAGLALLRDCGFRLPSEIITYRSFEHMRELVVEQIDHGRRIGITYSSREPLAPAEAHVNDPETIAYLNDKANLAELLPPDSFPERCVVSASEVPVAVRAFDAWPLVLKVASRLGTGAGADVVICRAPEDVEPARRALAAAERLVVEAFVEFARTWCLCFGIGAESISYHGAAEQICDQRGAYLGNWCRGDDPGPDAIAWAWHAARAGQDRGYRGFFGVDAGLSEGGRTYLFDLNYRNNGSTPQVLLRDSIARAWGAAVTRSCFGVVFNGTYNELIDQLASFFSRREVVPLLTFDASQLEIEDSRPVCNLLVAGRDPAAVDANTAALREAGFEIAHLPEPRPTHYRKVPGLTE
jgi:hypothetical protein